MSYTPDLYEQLDSKVAALREALGSGMRVETAHILIVETLELCAEIFDLTRYRE